RRRLRLLVPSCDDSAVEEEPDCVGSDGDAATALEAADEAAPLREPAEDASAGTGDWLEASAAALTDGCCPPLPLPLRRRRRRRRRPSSRAVDSSDCLASPLSDADGAAVGTAGAVFSAAISAFSSAAS